MVLDATHFVGPSYYVVECRTAAPLDNYVRLLTTATVVTLYGRMDGRKYDNRCRAVCHAHLGFDGVAFNQLRNSLDVCFDINHRILYDSYKHKRVRIASGSGFERP